MYVCMNACQSVFMHVWIAACKPVCKADSADASDYVVSLCVPACECAPAYMDGCVYVRAPLPSPSSVCVEVGVPVSVHTIIFMCAHHCVYVY